MRRVPRKDSVSASVAAFQQDRCSRNPSQEIEFEEEFYCREILKSPIPLGWFQAPLIIFPSTLPSMV